MPEENGQSDFPVVDDDGEEIEIEFVDLEDGKNEKAVAPAQPPAPKPVAAGPGDSIQAEVDHLREMYLRKLAEFDNFRKRTERERAEMKKIAAEGLVSELLPVLDNFQRAVQHADDSEPEAFREGVEMIAKQFSDLLARSGLDPIDPIGEQFNPELHEAVQRMEGSEYAPGTVVAVFTKGYTFGGRLIRPAMVGVAVEPVSPLGDSPPAGGKLAEGGGS